MKTREDFESKFGEEFVNVIMNNQVVFPNIYIQIMDAPCVSLFGAFLAIDSDNMSNCIKNDVEYSEWFETGLSSQIVGFSNNNDYKCTIEALYDHNIINIKFENKKMLVKINYYRIHWCEERYGKDVYNIIKKKKRMSELTYTKLNDNQE